MGAPERTRKVMLFELYNGGHHFEYLWNLADFWVSRGIPGRLEVVISREMAADHAESLTTPDLMAGGVRVHVAGERARLRRREDPLSLLHDDWLHGRELKGFVDALRPEHCLIMYFDTIQFSLAADLRSRHPARLSAIYFRPSFHYGQFGGGRPSTGERLKRFRKRIILRGALRNPRLDTLFCLDPFVVPHIDRMGSGVRAIHLPDSPGAAVRQRGGEGEAAELKGDGGRRTVLLFGAVDGRKGVLQVLDAMALLPADAQKGIRLVIAGEIAPAWKAAVLRGAERARRDTRVEVQVDDRRVPEGEAGSLFRRAAVVLATYRNHLGSSGILVRAAASGTPVLGTDYGLVGELIRRRKLGRAVDSAVPEKIAEGLLSLFGGAGPAGFDRGEALRFAGENTAGKFAETIFRGLGVLP